MRFEPEFADLLLLEACEGQAELLVAPGLTIAQEAVSIPSLARVVSVAGVPHHTERPSNPMGIVSFGL